MKKIMFNDKYGLTKAVLDGRKTMTRRAVNKITIDRANDYVQKVYGSGHDMLDYFLEHPLYKVGEVVAVAQKYSEIEIPISGETRIYNEGLDLYQSKLEYEPGWTNKMFVKADLMPHRIRITHIRVERLHSITVADCFKEGINTIVEGESKIGNPWGWDTKVDYFKRDNYLTPLQAFAALIDKVSGKGTWASNPWVFVYEFELVK